MKGINHNTENNINKIDEDDSNQRILPSLNTRIQYKEQDDVGCYDRNAINSFPNSLVSAREYNNDNNNFLRNNNNNTSSYYSSSLITSANTHNNNSMYYALDPNNLNVDLSRYSFSQNNTYNGNISFNQQFAFVNPQSLFSIPNNYHNVDYYKLNNYNNINNNNTNNSMIIRQPNAYRNEVHDPEDIYTPRWLCGKGGNKMGMCPICMQKGLEKWYKTKISSYWYHMNYFHGICSVTKRKFQDPLEIKYVRQPIASSYNIYNYPHYDISNVNYLVDKKLFKRKGLCHKCNRWIPLDSSKNMYVKIPDIFWRKHAQKCHSSKNSLQQQNNNNNNNNV